MPKFLQDILKSLNDEQAQDLHEWLMNSSNDHIVSDMLSALEEERDWIY